MSPAEAHPEEPPSSDQPHEITIGQRVVLTEQGKEAQVFTMTLGTETIELLPVKNWGQLDVHKWRVRGKLPGTPAGLEITYDRVRLAGETVSSKDPEASAKLEKLFNEWLALERGTLELARKKAVAKPPLTAQASQTTGQQTLRFQVELDKERQVHIRCLRGKEELAAIGLNLPGFQSLFSQGFMHKPRTIKVGALHDWVELDGVLFSFEQGSNSAASLERTLNERYLSDSALGQGKDVVVFANAASSTGFDIQFPVSVAGVPDNRRRPLNEESLELLQDPNKCGLLPKSLVIKLSRPNLIFKQKTPDGGERYLENSGANLVRVTGEDGMERLIDLSKPVNYLRLSAVELTAVFNHPAINEHSKQTPQPLPAPTQPQPEQSQPQPPPVPHPPAHAASVSITATPGSMPVEPAAPAEPQPSAPGLPEPAPAAPVAKPIEKPAVAEVSAKPEVKPLPNLWLKPVLSQRPIRHDWFACLVYTELARKFGNSSEGKFGPSACWFIALEDTEDISSSMFKGIFLTEKGGLGFLNRGHLARFSKGIAFIGTPESALEGIDVTLLAVGLDSQERIIFLVSEDFHSKFGVPDATIGKELGQLKSHGALVMSVPEALESPEPIEVVWTVPAEQQNPSDPQALESIRPGTEHEV